MHVIDLRSDTVTKPTPAMRKAMAEAEVGDDVYAEDPTVNRLQRTLAERAGFESGLFMPSGSMSNLVALTTHTERGQEVIAPEGAHIYNHELAGMAAVGGLIPRLVPAPAGVPAVEAVRAAIHRDARHHAPTGLVTLENTHNGGGGTVVPLEVSRAVVKLAHDEGLPVHLDGARAFNAAAALGADIAEVCAGFDSVSICLSKGLGAPVGSVLLGSEAFLTRAHRYRKLLGGGMRQAGVLAAAGLVALETMPQRLHEDHARARRLAEGLAGLPGVELELASVQSNMVFLGVADAAAFGQRCAQQGLRVNVWGPQRVRLVLHHQVSDEDVDRALEVLHAQLRPAATA
ncbi:MAG: GntG family PLP-dependent aldolase [Deinococcales bacterium]